MPVSPEIETPMLHGQELQSQKKREEWVLLGLSLPAIFVIALVVILPVGWLFYLSFVDGHGSFSLEHYQKMVEYKSYARVFITTFKVSALTTLICIVLGYPIAYFLAALPSRWSGIFMLAVLLPFWTSLLVRTYAWLVLLQRKGLLNNMAIDLGIISEPIKFVHNTSGTLIGMVHIMLPFLILPLYANMKAIDKDCLKAASSLGATPTRAFWTVFFPLSIPGLLAGLLIVFVLCLGFYVTPAVLGGGKVIMAAMKISSNIELYFSWGAASALGVVLLTVTAFILYIASKLVSIEQLSGGR